MPFTTQHNKTKQHTSNIRRAYYFHLAGKLSLSSIVMSAAHADKIILIFCEYKNYSQENNSTIICVILNHSRENFVIEIKQIS